VILSRIRISGARAVDPKISPFATALTRARIFVPWNSSWRVESWRCFADANGHVRNRTAMERISISS
jgi:hypothetical protein